MTEVEARAIITDYYLAESHSDDDKFLFVEALHFLIDAYHNPNDINNLAWHYAEEREFDLYRKYLEMAAEYGFHPAFEGLGYVWYYGQTGTVDYEKAFHYFSKGAESPDDYLRICCEYKIADMYHFGYYVDKDEERYKSMIGRLYHEISHPEKLTTIIPSEFLPNPSIYSRAAEIAAEEGMGFIAYILLENARILFAEYLQKNPSWWGNIEEMESVVMRLHELPDKHDDRINLYDLFWFAKKSCTMSFIYEEERFTIECIEEDRNIVIKFNNKWYRDPRSFFEKATIDGRPITALYPELIMFEVA